MATAVQIQIAIDDGGSPAVIGKVEGSLDSLGASAAAAQKRVSGEMQEMLANIGAAQKKMGGLGLSGAQTNSWHGPANALGESFASIGTAEADMQNLGLAFSQMPAKVKPALDSVQGFGKSLGGHTTTSLDLIRLLSQEFGIRLPRAMESALARMPNLASGLAGFSTGLLALGGAEVFFHIGEEIYDAEQKFVSITAASDKFYESLKKASEVDFTNTHSLGTTQMRLDQATQGMAQLPGIAKSMQQQGILSLLGNLTNPGGFAESMGLIGGAHEAAAQGATSAAQMVELTRKQLDQTHAQALAQIDLNHAMDATLSKRQQIAAAAGKQQQISAEVRGYETRIDKFYGNPAPGNAGATEQQAKDQQARAEASVKTIDLNNEESQAIIKARDAATQAGLQGEALFQAKQRDGVRELIAELNAQHLAEEIPARVKALNDQYRAEQIARVRELTAETQKQHAEVAGAGLTGAPRVLAERDAAVSGVDARQAKFSGGAPLSAEAKGDFDQQRADAAATATQKLKALDDDFTEHAQELTDQRTAANLGSFAKIDAAAKKQVDDLEKLYAKDYGDTGGSADSLKAKSNAENAIYADAATQRQQLQQKNYDEDAQYAREAAQAESRVKQDGVLGWVAAYKNGIAEIGAQEQQRLAKLDEDAQREGLTWQEVAQRREDVERGASAAVAEQNEQLQHTIAGQLQSAFTDPTAFIKGKMEQMFFEIVAAWIMRLQLFKNIFGDTMGGLQPGAAGSAAGSPTGNAAGGMGGLLGGALGHVLGIGGGAGVGHGIPTGASSGTAGVIQGGAVLPGSSTASSGTGMGFPRSSPGTYSESPVDAGASVPGLGAATFGGTRSTADVATAAGSSVAAPAAGATGYTAGTWSSPEVTFAGTTSTAGMTSAPASPSGAARGRGASAGAGSSTASRTGGTIATLTKNASSLASTFGLTKSQTPARSIPNADPELEAAALDPMASGEDGGFAGSITGDQYSLGIGDAGQSDVTAAAAQQSQGAMQSVAGAPSASGALSGVLGAAGAAGAAYSGTEGVVKSFDQGGLKGAIGGTMGGVEAGAAIGSFAGPAGTVVGGIIGGAAGLVTNLVGQIMGEPGKMAARSYYKKTLFPQLESIETSFNSGGGGDYLSAISQANSAEASGVSYMRNKWGSDAANYVKGNYLDKETQKVVGDITRLAGSGRQYIGKTAAEFHTGGVIGGFGDFATSANEGFIHAMAGEHVTMAQPAEQHAPMLAAINGGASPAQMAAMYLQAAGGGSRGGGSSVVNNHTHNYSAIDAKSFGKFLDGGGMKVINDSANRRASVYAGDAIG